MKEGDNALRRYVAQHYKGAGWRCDETIEGIMLSQDFHASEFVQVKVPNLYKGRFVLVGDSGYAGAAGMGTTLAMVGAYILAGEISKHSGNLKQALKNYEELMRPLINELQGLQPLFPLIIAPQSAWGLWIRNNILKFLSRTKMIEFGQRFMASAFANTDKSKLPNYK